MIWLIISVLAYVLAYLHDYKQQPKNKKNGTDYEPNPVSKVV